MSWRFSGLFALITILAVQLMEPPCASAVDVRCRVKTLKSPSQSNLKGRFQYEVSARGGDSMAVRSQLLVLDLLGNIDQKLPVSNNEIFEIQIGETIDLDRTSSNETIVTAPGVLFRATATEGGETSIAYCAPFAATRVDEPDTSSPSAQPVRLVAGYDKLVLESVRVLVDGVEVYPLGDEPATSTPYSRTIDIDGNDVDVADLLIDDNRGTISFGLSGLSAGHHRVTVKGDPVYGYYRDKRTNRRSSIRGILKHEKTIAVEEMRQPSEKLRLVFVRRNLRSQSHVDDIRDIARRASEHGYTGLVLSGSFDGIPNKPPEYYYRLQAIDKLCSDYGIELIPLLFTVGYGGILGHDRNLAAALPVKDLPITIKDGTGVLTSDRAVEWEDGSFEEWKPGETPAQTYCDKPGTVSVVDGTISHDGTQSLRLQNFEAAKNGHARLIRTMTVQPFRCYEIRCWVKTEDLKSGGSFAVQVISVDGRQLMYSPTRIKGTTDWTEVRTGFNSLDSNEVRVYAGVWSGQTGRLWIDNVSLREVGFLNVLRRPGTPITVRGTGANGGVIYKEGVDYEISPNENLTFRFDHPEPVLKTIPGGGIEENETLRIDYYQSLALKGPAVQVGVCTSEQKAYDLWENVVKKVHDQIAPNYYFISGDEIRHGGWCEACRSRDLSGGELIGDCFTRQLQLIQSVNPRAEVFVWSDMLDPNHNAVDNFYLVNGSIAGSWNHVPKDLIIACWYYKKRNESLSHFEKNGFRTIGCGYYDSGSLESTKEWIESLHATKGACGIMYTTWKDKYELLEAFGDLCRE